MPLILGIETSCDETSAAVVRDGTDVLSCVIATSKQEFASMGGVIPEYAARRQLESVLPVIDEALARASVQPSDLEAIAVTRGPGLLGSLLVGTTTARTLSYTWNVPLIGVHHNVGHLDSVWLRPSTKEETVNSEAPDTPSFPCLTLSVSGGHTELWHRTSHLRGTLLGETQDDAAGEAFDKGALLLGLPYPGGPALSKLAEDGDEHAHSFPLPLRGDGSCNFSFSGLKTALKYLLRDADLSSDKTRADIAASYQYAICLHLTDRIEQALIRHDDCTELHVVGGVSANRRLRTMLESRFAHVRTRWPSAMVYCTDNAAMIASAGYFYRQEKSEDAFLPFVTEARTRPPIGA